MSEYLVANEYGGMYLDGRGWAPKQMSDVLEAPLSKLPAQLWHRNRTLDVSLLPFRARRTTRCVFLKHLHPYCLRETNGYQILFYARGYAKSVTQLI